ncbi:uncharacterized protein LOC123557668 [Mercenaria mercenaria]|uniref:uncharacterized protein LOC123557668 n=1 Tax=Mercenaria mercenaria TaxID=6596 RepID=UPI00234F0512|nr:uncharacterized protein LOC123557668 [Mercenaria mercenaria]
MAESNRVTPWEDYNYIARLPDFWEVTGVVGGIALCRTYQAANLRPLNTNASRMMFVGYIIGGYLIGKAATVLRNNFQTRRQLFLEDYVDKHPEDFTSAEPKKFKEVLWEWKPHR